MRKRIDPLTLLHQLEEAGFSRAQAEAQLRLVLMIIESRSPTIRHLRLVEVRLGSDMQQLEARLQSDAKALHRLSFLRFTDREYKVLACIGLSEWARRRLWRRRARKQKHICSVGMK